MSQQDFDNFKQRIKEWMDSHPDEYDCFEEEMNRKDNAGYQKILKMAFTIVPKYQKIIRKRSNQGSFDDIADIEKLFSESKLAETLISSFDKFPSNAVMPAMLSWLYFGKSFERMVERGEEIRKNTGTGYLEKHLITFTIKTLISKSISLGLRTKSDWEEHRNLMMMADSDHVMDLTLQSIPDEKNKVGRKTDYQNLPENLFTPIGNFLKSHNSQYDIACLKIALEEMSLLSTGGIKAFKAAIDEQYGDSIHIISERGIQKAYKELNDFIGEGKTVKDLKENRTYIEEIKKLLSD